MWARYWRLPSLGEAFFAVNSDVFWLDNEPPALLRLAATFDPDTMDAVLLLHRRLFDEAPGSVFSLVRLFDRAEKAGRLAAIVHDGEWYHVGTPEGLASTRERLASNGAERYGVSAADSGKQLFSPRKRPPSRRKPQ